MKKYFVFGYINPDTDGVGSSIGYAELLYKSEGISAVPIVIGKINNETKYVLEIAGLAEPQHISQFTVNDTLYIVDTHHVNQLPNDLPFSSVAEILDHHPFGNPEAFPNAQIVNEEIGAVATLIVEKFNEKKIIPSASCAMILYAAIISNTLAFKAPTTTKRDIDASNWLKSLLNIPHGFETRMFEMRSNISGKSTKDILLSDYKEFNFSGIVIGIAQLETTALDAFLARSNLMQTLRNILIEKNLKHIFLNGADILNQRGVLVAYDPNTQFILKEIVPGISFEANYAPINRILLRKSDFIVQLTDYFKANL